MRVLELTLFVSVPASVGLMLVAPVMVPVVLGQQWLEVVPIMQALAWLGITRVVLSTAMPGFLAARRPDLPARIVGVTLLLRAALYLFAFDRFGIAGLALAVVVTDAVQSVFLLTALSRIGLLDIRELALAVWRVPLASALMALTVEVMTDAVTLRLGVLLASEVALGALVYVAAVLALWWVSGRPPGAEARMLGLCAKALRRKS